MSETVREETCPRCRGGGLDLSTDDWCPCCLGDGVISTIIETPVNETITREVVE